jgi:hypothetical protein
MKDVDKGSILNGRLSAHIYEMFNPESKEISRSTALVRKIAGLVRKAPPWQHHQRNSKKQT